MKHVTIQIPLNTLRVFLLAFGKTASLDRVDEWKVPLKVDSQAVKCYNILRRQLGVEGLAEVGTTWEPGGDWDES